jgi:uncharacterized protein
MTRRLSIGWPDPRPFRDRDGDPIRLLAISDSVEPVLWEPRNRVALGRVDLVLGCGDLPASHLGFVADAVNAQLLHVWGNHDGPDASGEDRSTCPAPIPSGVVQHASGLAIAGLSWPGPTGRHAERHESRAWWQVLQLATRRLGRHDPLIVISHVPPFGAGDLPGGEFHRGMNGYRWFMDRERPRLWLHGHTPLAGAPEWRLEVGGTTLVNVTGAVLIELRPETPAEG